MTRKDYVAVASRLRIRRGVAATPAERDTIDGIARDLASIFEADNPRFDRDRFLSAARGAEVKP